MFTLIKIAYYVVEDTRANLKRAPTSQTWNNWAIKEVAVMFYYNPTNKYNVHEPKLIFKKTEQINKWEK